MKDLHGFPLIINLVKTVFPLVNGQLAYWKGHAGMIVDETLKAQALSSIKSKKFHCQGGSAYALYPDANINDTIQFIIAFQTISDYLDNLCDRTGVTDEAAFRQLHRALLDAVDPNIEPQNYYLYYPQKDDGGYLPKLVAECRYQVQKLPSLNLTMGRIKQLVSYYIDLQVYKHIVPSLREEKLELWASPLTEEYTGLSIWEFCAAAGSTLSIFVLIAVAQNPCVTVMEVDAIYHAYFPWACGLHILLDYYIDFEEDLSEGDFNFTSYYRNSNECIERLSFFVEKALTECSSLIHPGFHRTVVHGLLAMYLSDQKSNTQMNKQCSRQILKCGGIQAQLYQFICCVLRRHGKL